jgi:hypothetical protein
MRRTAGKATPGQMQFGRQRRDGIVRGNRPGGGANTRLIAHPKLFVEIPRPFSIRHRVSDDVESFDLSSIDVVKVIGKNYRARCTLFEV